MIWNFFDLRCKRYWIWSNFIIENSVKLSKKWFWKKNKVGQQVHTWENYLLTSSKWFTTTKKFKSWVKVFSIKFTLRPTTHATLVAIILDNSSKIAKIWEFIRCGGENFYSLTIMQNHALISSHENEYIYWHDMGIPKPKIHRSY